MSTRYGIIEDESIDDYHQSPALSHSKVEFFRDNFPRTYSQKYVTRTLTPDGEKPHFLIGNAAECLVSYGDEKFGQQYATHPATYKAPASKNKDAPIIDKIWNWNATACNEWAENEAKGRAILSPEQTILCGRMRDAVMRNPDARALIAASRPQVTFRSKGAIADVQCRTDFYSPGGTILPSTGKETGPFEADLKTFESLSPSAFRSFDRKAYELGYHRAQVWYRMVIRRVLSEIAGQPEVELPYVDRYFIVVDKKEWPSCTVFKMPQVMLEEAECELLGSTEARGLLPRLLDCIRKNDWPDAPVFQEIAPPRHLQARDAFIT